MRVSVATTISQVQELRPLWEELYKRNRATIFQDFDWNLLALRTFPQERPYFLAAELGSSAAIIPAVTCGDDIRLAGGPLFDYRDVVCAGGSAALQLAIERVADLHLPIQIEGIRSDSTLESSSVATQPWTVAPYVALDDISPETFSEKHTRSRRSCRRLTDLGASVRIIPGTPELLERIYREKAKEPAAYGGNVFRDPRCINFMRHVVMLPRTRCEVFLMEVSSDPIAALVTFLDGDVRRFYTTWMNEQWSKHSPGIALLYEATCQTLASGLDCDYMTGEQHYKMRFATGSIPLYKVERKAFEAQGSSRPEHAKAA